MVERVSNVDPSNWQPIQPQWSKQWGKDFQTVIDRIKNYAIEGGRVQITSKDLEDLDKICARMPKDAFLEKEELEQRIAILKDHLGTRGKIPFAERNALIIEFQNIHDDVVKNYP